MPAFGSYKKRQEKPEINDIPQWQKVFQQVVSDDIAAAKKPVRWNFRKNNEGLFQLSQSLDPYAKLNEGLVELLLELNKIFFFKNILLYQLSVGSPTFTFICLNLYNPKPRRKCRLT